MIIRNLWCVGRNYADHAKELGNEVPKTPLIFLKAGSGIIHSGQSLQLPAWSHDVHHEVELALQFDENLELTSACVAIDFTLRDIQNQLKSQQSPWTLAKSFKHSTALGNFFKINDLTQVEDFTLQLTINGESRQMGSTHSMIFKAEALKNYILEHFPVVPYDLILTGTPKGVGPVRHGDHIQIQLLSSHDGKEDVRSSGQWTASFA